MLDGATSFVDGWTLVEDQLIGSRTGIGALFTTSNGYVGIRGHHREPIGREGGGVLMAGFFEGRPYAHPEESFGLPERYQTIVQVTDPTIADISIDGVAVLPDSGTWLEHRRVLDLRTGCVSTSGRWRSPDGRTASIGSRRMASLEEAGVAWLEVTVEPEDGPAEVAIEMHLRANTSSQTFPDEPEALSRAWGRIFRPAGTLDEGRCIGLVQSTSCSELAVACAASALPGSPLARRQVHADCASLSFEDEAAPGRPLVTGLRVTYADGTAEASDEVLHEAAATLRRHTGRSFDDAVAVQRDVLDDFWEAATVELEGAPDVERAVRYSTFQLFQASALNPGRASPAKGLTGQGYQGHQLWEEEVYAGQVLTLLAPHVARTSLGFRHTTLPSARRRAAELSERGAQFPWRTIDGSEASAFLPAGAAQQHINADIAWAVEHYVGCTGDDEFLLDKGVELLVETARLWMSLGHLGRDGRFHIHSVTGPDEYTAIVDDNLYTNVMAAANLEAAAARVEWLAAKDATAHAALRDSLELHGDEMDAWRSAARSMHVPYDEELGVHAQDDEFLQMPRWDLAGTPPERFPLQDHHHLLTLYRHQVLKQADVVLAGLLQSERFSTEQRLRDFEYYEPLTTHDSSLSAPIHAVVAADLGKLELAWSYTEEAALVDLEDRAGSLSDGLHMAAAAGSWIAVARGFGGFAVRDGLPRFGPQLPPKVEHVSFRLRFRGALLKVDIDSEGTTYELLDGGPLSLIHHGEMVELQASKPVSRR